MKNSAAIYSSVLLLTLSSLAFAQTTTPVTGKAHLILPRSINLPPPSPAAHTTQPSSPPVAPSAGANGQMRARGGHQICKTKGGKVYYCG